MRNEINEFLGSEDAQFTTSSVSYKKVLGVLQVQYTNSHIFPFLYQNSVCIMSWDLQTWEIVNLV